MTGIAAVAGWCGWCGAPLDQVGRGRPRRYCDDVHRANAWRYRKTLRECGQTTGVCLQLHGGVPHRWKKGRPSA